MKAGLLRTRLKVLRRPPGVDEVGQANSAWIVIDEIDAQIGSLTGREPWLGAKFVSEVDGKVMCRYRPTLRATDRFRLIDASGVRDLDMLAILDSAMAHEGMEIPFRWVADMGDGANEVVSTDVTVAITGNAAAGSIGSIATLNSDVTVVTTGNAAAGSTGSVVPLVVEGANVTVGITGHATVGSSGIVDPHTDVTVAITGNAAAGSAGSVGSLSTFESSPTRLGAGTAGRALASQPIAGADLIEA